METPTLPERSEAVRDLEQLLPVLFRAVEAAMQRARDFFMDYERAPFDRNLFPSLFRYYAKRELRRAGHEATDEEELALFQEWDIPNNGLMLVSGQYEIRILKSYEGQLPPPNSDRRREFYNQTRWRSKQTPLPGVPATENKRTSTRTLGLVMLWDVTERFELHSIDLVCPRAIGPDGVSIKEHWRVSLYAIESPATVREAVELPADLPVVPKGQPRSLDADAENA